MLIEKREREEEEEEKLSTCISNIERNVIILRVP